jgi:hypothetical protein
LRVAGTAFDVEVRMEHPGITAALRTCAAFESRYPDLDDRLRAYDDLEFHFKIAVDPREVRDVRSLSRNVRALMREAIALADGVRVRSWEEAEVLRVVFETTFEPVFVAPVIHELPPVEVTERRDAVVVWAPDLRAEDCAIYAAALDDLRLSVFIVGARGERVAGNAQFVPFEQAGEVLSRAAAILDASTTDPGWAIALAELGRPLAVVTSSGAHAYLDGVIRFRPWMRGDIALAVAHALGAEPPRRIGMGPARTSQAERVPTIAVTAASAPAVLVDCVARRSRGETFELLLDIGHPYADAAGAIASNLFASEPDADARALAYDAFAAKERNDRGDAAPSVTMIPPPILETLRQCAVLADRLVYRSQTEAIRTNSILGLYDRPMRIAQPADATVPSPERRDPDGRIVVWAPAVPEYALGIVRIALEGIGYPVTIVDEATDGAFKRDALVHASIVIAPAHDAAGSAIALVAWGIPLCACASSGAGEWLHDVSLYLPADRAAIRAATLATFDVPPPSLRPAPLPVLPASIDIPQHAGPAVLCVVRVREGSDGLERTRASIAQQRYANIETIECAGGGGRIARSVNAAVRASGAEYVAVVDAGDELFPDHIASLVTALERSKRDVAYAETLIAHAAPGDGIAGYTLVARKPVEVASMSVFDAMLAAPLRSLIRREELIEAGGWNEHLPNAGDHELFLRLKKRADFVYVARVTSRTWRPRSAAVTPEIGVLFAEYQLVHLLHPVPGRPALAAKRAEALGYLKTARDFSITPPPMRLT